MRQDTVAARKGVIDFVLDSRDDINRRKRVGYRRSNGMGALRSLWQAGRATCNTAVCTRPPLHAQAPVTLRGLTRYPVGEDRSASRTPQQMKDLRVFLGHLTGALDFGDELSLVEVRQHDSDAIREFRDSLPRAEVPQRPTRRELGMREALRQTFRTGHAPLYRHHGNGRDPEHGHRRFPLSRSRFTREYALPRPSGDSFAARPREAVLGSFEMGSSACIQGTGVSDIDATTIE